MEGLAYANQIIKDLGVVAEDTTAATRANLSLLVVLITRLESINETLVKINDRLDGIEAAICDS